MSKVLGWSIGGFLGLAMMTVTGCGSSTTVSTDMASAPLQICTPNDKTCLNTTTAVVCSSDGLSRIPVQCGLGQICTNGTCGADPNPACTSADDGCMNATTALRCSATNVGFDVVACPANTACVGPGLCQGSCIVGSSLCLDNNTVSTCNDGSTYTSTACTSGQACVATGTTPYATAACAASACTPDPNGCDFVCGDKTNPGGPNQTTTISTCVQTPAGYKWAAVTCVSPKTCNPSGSACSSGTGSQAACTEQCTPGDTRCTDDLNVQTCGTDGTWASTVTACNATAGNAPLVCFTNAAGKGVCGDRACVDSSGNLTGGACDADGKFHVCGADGKVSGDATTCASGTCVSTGNFTNGTLQPGACVSVCSTGDERCVLSSGSGGSFEDCVNGLWGPSQQCASGKLCQNTTSVSGHPGKVCGDCTPGTHKCGGTNNQQLVTCGTDATYGTPADCTTGVCTYNNNVTDAVCVAECFPGKKVCLGGPVTVPGVGVDATDSDGTCNTNGTLPTATACTSGSYCRRGPSVNGNGTALGCVVCVGGQNEFGLRDSRCENVGDTGSGNYLEECLANSSGWDLASHFQCVTPNSVCVGPSTNVSFPPAAGNYCHGGFGIPAFTASALAAFGATCNNLSPGSVPISCALPSGASVPDCCDVACSTDTVPTPAACAP